MTVPFTGPLMIVEGDQYQFLRGGGEGWYVLDTLVQHLGRTIK